MHIAERNAKHNTAYNEKLQLLCPSNTLSVFQIGSLYPKRNVKNLNEYITKQVSYCSEI